MSLAPPHADFWTRLANAADDVPNAGSINPILGCETGTVEKLPRGAESP